MQLERSSPSGATVCSAKYGPDFERGMKSYAAKYRASEKGRRELLDCLIHLTERDWFKEGLSGYVACSLDADKVRAAVLNALPQNAHVLPLAGAAEKKSL